MIRNDRDDAPRKNRVEGDYQEPEYITITITDPVRSLFLACVIPPRCGLLTLHSITQITHEVNGKKSHTSYLITTDVLSLCSRRLLVSCLVEC